MRSVICSHEHLAVNAESRADLLARTGCGQSVRAHLDKLLFACDIAACGSDTAARVLDKRACHEVNAYRERLNLLDELAVAVVEHDDRFRRHALCDITDFLYLTPCQSRAQAVAARTLDIHHLRLLCGDVALSLFIVDGAVGQQVGHLKVDVKILERTGVVALDADRGTYSVVRHSGHTVNSVVRAENAEQSYRQRVGAAHEVVADKSVLCVKGEGVYPVESVPAEVVVAVARGSAEVTLAHSRVLERLYHLHLMVFLDIIYLAQFVRAERHSLL